MLGHGLTVAQLSQAKVPDASGGLSDKIMGMHAISYWAAVVGPGPDSFIINVSEHDRDQKPASSG